MNEAITDGMRKGIGFANKGSAVIPSEVFLKALSIARNLEHHVVKRPPIEGCKGYNITEHHELMISLLYKAILEELK